MEITQEWIEEQGDWIPLGWVDENDFGIDATQLNIEIIDADKHGHPIKAIVK